MPCHAPREEVQLVRVKVERRELVAQDGQRFLRLLELHRLEELLLPDRKLDGLQKRATSARTRGSEKETTAYRQIDSRLDGQLR